MKSIAIALVAAAIITGSASCQQKQNVVIPSQEVAGTYTGTVSVAFSYSTTPMTYEGQTFTVTAVDDNTVDVSYTSDVWGSYTVSSANVSGSNPYSISGSGTVAMGMGGSTNDYDFTLEGSINSDTDAASFTISIPAVMGGVTVSFVSE